MQIFEVLNDDDDVIHAGVSCFREDKQWTFLCGMAFVCENVRQQLPWLWGLYKCETGGGVALLVENLTSVLEGLSLMPAPHKPGMFMCCNPGMQQVEAGRLEGHCHPYQFKASLASVRRDPL